MRVAEFAAHSILAFAYLMASTSTPTPAATQPSPAFTRWRVNMSAFLASSAAESSAQQPEESAEMLHAQWTRCERWKKDLMHSSAPCGPIYANFPLKSLHRPANNFPAKAPGAARLPHLEHAPALRAVRPDARGRLRARHGRDPALPEPVHGQEAHGGHHRARDGAHVRPLPLQARLAQPPPRRLHRGPRARPLHRPR